MTQMSLLEPSPAPRSRHAGPRQTVDLVEHPQRGRGFAVRENGPSFFETIEGERIDMPITMGGAGPEGAWRNLQDPTHGTVRAKVLEVGERHDRRWHRFLGEGWLVWGSEENMRFEADGGQVISFSWLSLAAGTPDYVKRTRRRHIEMTEEEKLWVTFHTADGEVYSFRRDEAPQAPGPRPQAPRPQAPGPRPQAPGPRPPIEGVLGDGCLAQRARLQLQPQAAAGVAYRAVRDRAGE